jgi:hypothetical protein
VLLLLLLLLMPRMLRIPLPLPLPASRRAPQLRELLFHLVQLLAHL